MKIFKLQVMDIDRIKTLEKADRIGKALYRIVDVLEIANIFDEMVVPVDFAVFGLEREWSVVDKTGGVRSIHLILRKIKIRQKGNLSRRLVQGFV